MAGVCARREVAEAIRAKEARSLENPMFFIPPKIHPTAAPQSNLFEFAQILPNSAQPLAGLLGVERRTDLVHMRAVATNDLVEFIPADPKLFGPMGDIGGHFWIDLFWVVRSLG